MNGQTLTVTITDHNNNIENALIDCTYDFVPPQKIQLTATFPVLETTTDYTSSAVAYNITGNLADGNPIAINADDVWSATVPVGFVFCFYGNSYSTFNVSDNGIVRFGYNPATPEGSFSSIGNTTPSPSLIRNAIFGGFHDYIVAPVGFGCTTDCGTITSYTIGTAPFRKTIINFNGVNYFNCTGLDAQKAYFQIILSETTNEIEVNVQEKPLPCLGNISANGNGNSLIGLNNATGTLGVAPAGRNTSEFAVTNESYKFTPSGASATTIVWTDQFGVSLGSSNPIEVIPPQANTFYTATVTYNTCVSKKIAGVFNVTYDPSFPVSINIVDNVCDVATPFPNQIHDVTALVAPIVGETITFHNSQLEADNNVNALPNMDVYNLTAATTVFYYRRTLGTCYSTAKITINLYQTPDLNDVTINYCDAGNDGVENNINLSSLTSQITGFNSAWMTATYFQNAANAIANVNPVTSINITDPPGFYDVYVRIRNTASAQCFDIIKVRLQLLQNLVLNPPTASCIVDTNFDFQELFDLTSIAVTASTGPVNPSDLTLSYYTSLANATNQTNPILNPNFHNVIIPSGQPDVTVYIVANANGYCRGIIPIVLTFCVAEGGDGGGGGGGGGGFGGLGACLEVGDVIPTFDLNIVYANVMTAIPVVPVPTPVGFYTTLLGAQTQDILVELSLADISAFTPVAPFSEIWVRFTDVNGIVGIKRIIVPLKFKKHEVKAIEICDVYNDNIEFIDLQNSPVPVSYLQEIRNENPGELVTAYASMPDYLSNSNPITTITVTGTTTVYVKVSSYGCDSDYTLNFTLKSFDIKTPIVTKVCDIDSDGTEIFDLNILLPTVDVTGYTTPILSLHNTLNDAYTGLNPISNPNLFTVNAASVVFVRIVESAVLPPNTPIVCPAIQEFQFGFYDSVNVNNIGLQEYCDLDNDNQVVLGNLNALVTSIVIEDPLQPIVKKLYSTLLAAQNSDAVFEILPDWDLFTYDTTIFGTTGFIYLQLTNTVTNCTRIAPIAIEIKSLPLTVNTTVNYCDFENDNNETIADFQVFNSQIITLNSVLYNFQYFGSTADATAGTPQLPSGYNIQDGTIIYVSIQSGLVAGCSSVYPIEINFNDAPVVTNIAPVVCDNLGNGSETINLFSYQSQLVGSITGLTFQYYNNLTDLQNGLNMLSNANITNYNAIFDASNNAPVVYVKVINNVTQCFSIATISLQRNVVIDAFDTTQFSCDISTTNQLQAVFDLEASILRVGTNGMIANPAAYIISFHISNANAISNTSPIVNTTNYAVVANQTTNIYVRFQDLITGCYTVKILELQIYNLPKFVNSVFDICDENLDGIYTLDLTVLNGTVVENTAPFTFEYFNSEADGLAGINAIVDFANYTIPLADFPKTIYVKGTNANNCSKVKGVIIRIKPSIPLLVSSVDLIECDADNNGLESFNLTQANAQLTNATGVSFSYFETLQNMQNNVSPITTASNYQNNTTNLIYVRLTKDSNYCDTYGTINLIPFYEDYVFPTLTNFCDNNANGTETIDLEETVYTILNTYAPTSISLEFYNSNADAIAGINTISALYNFTNFTIPIFVKITNNATSCSIIKQLNYNFYSPIVLTSYAAKICDLDRNDTEIIDLSSYFNALNSNFSTYTITSYLSENGAENEIASELISNTNYTQLVANQTYWIRFQDAAGCYSVTSIAIEIVAYPDPLTNPTKIELCDVNGANDLSEIFDITLNENYIRNGNTSWTITYHNTESEALNGNNPIANPTGFNSPSTSIWIRVVTTPVSSLTSCAVVIEQELEVIPLPTPNLTPQKIVLCDDNLTGDLQEEFDISQNITYIRNGDDDVIVSYHATQNDAQNGTNPIVTTTSYLTGTTSVWIRVQSNTSTTLTTCAVVVEQQLEVVAKPYNLVLTLPTLIKCDDVNSGNLTENFDLSTNSNLLLNGNTTYQLTYHATPENAASGLQPILNFTAYETASATIYIRVIALPANPLTSCAVVVEQKIIVNPLPNTSPVASYLSCIINATGQASFDLSTKTAEVLNGQNPSLFTVKYHLTEVDAKQVSNAIASPYLSTNTTIWASIKNNQTNCVATVSFLLVTENTPFANQPNPLVLCDEDGINDGYNSFNLSLLIPEILGVQNGNSNISIAFYESYDLLLVDEPIATISNYENLTSPQTLYVKVIDESTQNKCMVTTSFEIRVDLLPEPTPQDGFICTDPVTNELLSTFIIDSGLSSTSYSFEWYNNTTLLPNETGSTLEVSQGGDYFVVATDLLTNCVSEPKASTVIVSQPALATVRVEYSFQNNIKIIVNTVGNGSYVYQLDNGEIQSTNVFQNFAPGIHEITVYDLNGCDSVKLEAVVFDYDKYFTPNGDGYNDTWHIRGIEGQPEAKVYIYDRYGKLLKQLISGGAGWDGKYNSHDLPSTDYWFTVFYKENGENKEFKSHFSLKR